MQNKGIDICAQLSDHERHPVSHEAADEVNVPAEAVQFGDGHGALELLSSRKSCLELWAAVESIGAFAGLNLNELPNQLQTFSLCELVE